VETLLPAAIQELERRGDMRGLASAHLVAGLPHVVACRADATAAEVRLATQYARAAGDDGLRDVALFMALGALREGSTPATEIGRELDEIEAERPGPFMKANLDYDRGNLAMLAGRFDEGRALMQRSRHQLEALGQRLDRVQVTQGLAHLELGAGNRAGARDLLLETDTILAASGDRGFRSTNQAMLAVVYEQLGRRDAAVTALELAETLGAKDDVINLVLTYPVRARIALGDARRQSDGRGALWNTRPAPTTSCSRPRPSSSAPGCWRLSESRMKRRRRRGRRLTCSKPKAINPTPPRLAGCSTTSIAGK
jgi:hypothetical protein